MMWCAITVEGVLARPSDDLVSAPPLPEGMLLYRMLASTQALLLLTDNRDPRLVEHWLKTQHMSSHTRVVLGIEGLPAGMPTRLRQVARLRAGGLALRLVIDPDVLTCQHLAADGVTGTAFISPLAGTRSSKPKLFTPRPWDEMNV